MQLAIVTSTQVRDTGRNPKFSVIVPTYNRGEKIYPTLDSVLVQAERDFELIVVDDGSTDSTFEALERYAQRVNDPRMRIIRRENGGTTAARNTGIAAVTGDYVALLDHDDLWFAWTLQTYRKCIEEFEGTSFLAGWVVPHASPSVSPQPTEAGPGRSARFEHLLAAGERNWRVYPSGWAIKTEVLRSVGGFFRYNRGFEDHDLMLRLGTAPGYVRISEPALGVRGIHESNLSSDRNQRWFARGLKVLLDREQSGQYPGGAKFEVERRKMICSTARVLGLGCVRVRQFRTAWWIYRKTFGWHVRQGRVRFLMGFPTVIAFNRLRVKRKAPGV